MEIEGGRKIIMNTRRLGGGEGRREKCGISGISFMFLGFQELVPARYFHMV